MYIRAKCIVGFHDCLFINPFTASPHVTSCARHILRLANFVFPHQLIQFNFVFITIKIFFITRIIPNLFYSFFLVCSVREFCLQRLILLLVVCTFLQLGSFLFAVRGSFACSVHSFLQFPFCLQCAGVDFFRRVLYCCKEFFSLQCFLFVKAVSPVGHRTTQVC